MGTLKEFLKSVKGNEEDIISYEGQEAILQVQRNGHALQYVKKQTEEICKLAVQQYGYALQYVKEQTEEICKLAVQRNGYALQYVKEQTEEICKLAVQRNGDALRFVDKNIFSKIRIIKIDDKEIEISEESYQKLKESLLN